MASKDTVKTSQMNIIIIMTTKKILHKYILLFFITVSWCFVYKVLLEIEQGILFEEYDLVTVYT